MKDMKKNAWTLAVVLLASVCVAGGPSVKVTYTGPSGQGDVKYIATATGVTNLTMGTGGLYNVTFDPRYSITITLAAGTIDGSKLVAGTISNVNIADNAIDGTQLINGTVSNVDIADSAIDGTQIIDGTISNADVADRAITGMKLPSVTDGQILIGATDDNKLNVKSVSGSISITSNGVATVGAGAITNSMLTGGIDASKLGAASVMSAVDIGAATNLNASALDDGSIPTARIAAGTITNSQLTGGIDASKLGAASVASAIDISAATNINASALASGSIPTARIAAGTITNSQLTGGIDASKLAAASVMAAVDLSAGTNIAGGSIASGNIAAARIATALGTSGASIGGNIPIAALTNAVGADAALLVFTNKGVSAGVGYTNVVTVIGKITGDLAP